jgi:dCMP deaminase
MNWHEYFFALAELASEKSKDLSTKVGAVIVGPDNEVRSVGFNGFPRGVDDGIHSRHERPAKYQYTEHAERNAIYNAARVGIPLKGCTIYMKYCPRPCTDCARAVIQSGIVRVVGRKSKPFPGKGAQWEEDLRVSEQMLAEAGVEVVWE